MKIEYRNIDEVRPYGKNAKKHPEKQVRQIADSINQFGFNQPIVVDQEGVIIVGHGRYLAACLLGMIEVPVLPVNISEDRIKAYRLADNKLNESDWDMELVISELNSLEIEMVDLTGFDRKLVLNSNDKDDDVPALPKNPRTKYGDLYKLGSHYLLCGDSTKQEDYLKLLGEHKADMLFTDPPYNVNYKGSGTNTSQGIMNDKMEEEAFAMFLSDAFANVRKSVKDGGGMYIFHSPTTQRVFEEAMRLNGIDVVTQLIWNKPSAGLGMNAYRAKHEPFFYAGAKGQTPQFYGDRTNTSVIDFHKTDEQLAKWAKQQKQAELEGRTTIWTMKRTPVQDYVHPTQKPVELIMYALHNSSKVDDIILDPFLGSGSTLIACEKTNRHCYGLELDPAFADVIVQRYVDYTNSKDIHCNGEPMVW